MTQAPPPPLEPAWGPPPPPPFPPPPPPNGARTGVVLGVVAAVLVVGVALTVPLVLSHRDDTAAGEHHDASDRTSATAVPGAADTGTLADVQVYDGLTRNHVTTPQDYPQSPPVGGDHYPVWMDCGAYDRPVNDDNAVHDLEHGTVWITYRPGLDAASVATLERALPPNGIVSPYPGLQAPVVVTVWGRQLALTGADDPRLRMFVLRFKDGVTAPEPLASCAGGLTDPAGGIDASGGTTA